MIKCFKKNYRKTGKKKYYDVDADVAQLKRNNNKYYVSAFRDIYVYIYMTAHIVCCLKIYDIQKQEVHLLKIYIV